MTKKHEVYRCSVCGNIVEVINAGAYMMCCGRPMTLLKGRLVDSGAEKHVPVVRVVDGGYRITVGSVEHPMDEGHFIQWIELLTKDCVMRREFTPGCRPEVIFQTDASEITVRAYCNLHGLWIR